MAYRLLTRVVFNPLFSTPVVGKLKNINFVHCSVSDGCYKIFEGTQRKSFLILLIAK